MSESALARVEVDPELLEELRTIEAEVKAETPRESLMDRLRKQGYSG